jgi:hypothetical protein
MQLTVTLAAIHTGITATGKNEGQPFAKSQKATAHFKGGDKEITVMAFSPVLQTVADQIVEGAKITVTAVWDGKNTMRIIGPARAAAPAEAAAA